VFHVLILFQKCTRQPTSANQLVHEALAHLPNFPNCLFVAAVCASHFVQPNSAAHTTFGLSWLLLDPKKGQKKNSWCLHHHADEPDVVGSVTRTKEMVGLCEAEPEVAKRMMMRTKEDAGVHAQAMPDDDAKSEMRTCNTIKTSFSNNVEIAVCNREEGAKFMMTPVKNEVLGCGLEMLWVPQHAPEPRLGQ